MKILSLSGFVPEQICDTLRFMKYENGQSISHYCGYVSDFITQVMQDTSVDGAVFPRTCDSSRVISSYLEQSGKFLYQMNVPARQDAAAIGFLTESIKNYKEAIESHYKVNLNDIEARAELVNNRNLMLKKLYDNLDTISYGSYLNMIHKMLTQPLAEQKITEDDLRVVSSDNNRVYLVGSFLSNPSIVETIENAGMKIVGDNLTESKRLFSAPSVIGGDNIYESIAKSMLENRLSPTQNNFEKILEADLKEIKEKNIKGVIYATQKYCEPYDYLFSCYKKMLQDNNIPVLRITSTDSVSGRIPEYEIEAFADML